MILGTTKKTTPKTDAPSVPFAAMTIGEKEGILSFSPKAVELLNTHVMFSITDEGLYVIPCELKLDGDGKVVKEEYTDADGVIRQIGKNSKRAVPGTGNVSYKDLWNALVGGEDPQYSAGNVLEMVPATDINDVVANIANDRPVYKLQLAFDNESEAIEQATINTNNVAQ